MCGACCGLLRPVAACCGLCGLSGEPEPAGAGHGVATATLPGAGHDDDDDSDAVDSDDYLDSSDDDSDDSPTARDHPGGGGLAAPRPGAAGVSLDFEVLMRVLAGEEVVLPSPSRASAAPGAPTALPRSPMDSDDEDDGFLSSGSEGGSVDGDGRAGRSGGDLEGASMREYMVRRCGSLCSFLRVCDASVLARNITGAFMILFLFLRM